MKISASKSFFTYSSPSAESGREKGYILLHAAEPRWLVANQTTLDIARSLEKGLSIDDIAAGLAARYNIPIAMAAQDVRYVAEQLEQRRLLVPATTCEPPRPALSSLTFHVTTRCNLRCSHCYVSCPSDKDLPASLILRLIEELKDSGGRELILSGGEPLLHPEIKRILKYAAPRLSIQLLSNGTLIDRDWAAFLAGEVNPTIQISLDGSNAEIHDLTRGQGSFEKTLRGIEFLKEAGLTGKIILSTTVMTHNYHDLRQIIKLAQKLDVFRSRFIPLRRAGRAADRWDSIGGAIRTRDYETFFDFAFDLRGDKRPSIDVYCGLSGFKLDAPEECANDGVWCPLGRQLVVDTHGDVFPCVLLMYEQFRLGNVFRDEVSEMMQSEILASTCRAFIERREKIEKCAACHWRNLCQAGCMGEAMAETGSIWKTDAFCEYRKKTYQRAFDRMLDEFVRGHS